MGGRVGKVVKALCALSLYSVNPRVWLATFVGALVVFAVAQSRRPRVESGDSREELAARAERLARDIYAFLDVTSLVPANGVSNAGLSADGLGDRCAEFETRFGTDTRAVHRQLADQPGGWAVPGWHQWPVTDDEMLAVADHLAAAAGDLRGYRTAIEPADSEAVGSR